ncbi:MAG TPA: FmdB family zinc ribbon protein [Thermoanaerobaculia bacterium]|nr:FmdB family zinc ribbon protein [Thermoanaerobaculia bacterium]
MPIYDYLCEQCAETTEAIQRMGDPPLVVCPKCGGPLRKKISAPAFQFKGSGWYVTDYARKGESAARSSDSSESGGDDSSAGSAKKIEPKPETKPEPKPEPKPETKPEPAAKGAQDSKD